MSVLIGIKVGIPEADPDFGNIQRDPQESKLLKATRIMGPREKVAYLAGHGLTENALLLATLKELQFMPMAIDPSNTSTLAELDCATAIIVFEEFTGTLFDSVRRSNKIRIFGVPAILDTARQPGEPHLRLGHSCYPLYSHHLRNCRVAVTGIRTKEQLHELRRLILYMDGIFLEKEAPFSHLVADKVRGNKYRDAVALGRLILSPEWIKFLWEHRNEIVDFNAKLEDFKVKAFHKCYIAFEGFEDVEKESMHKLVDANGGFVVEPDNSEATHIVKSANDILPIRYPTSSLDAHTPPMRTIDQLENDDYLKSPKKRPRFDPYVINDLDDKSKERELAKRKDYPTEKVKIMKAEWFWSSIQIDACAAEADYLFFEPLRPSDEFGNASIGTFANSFTSPINYAASDTDGGTPNSGSGTPQSSVGRRKRKRQRELISALTVTDCPRFITDIPEDVETANLGGSSLPQMPQNLTDAMFATILKEVTEVITSADYSSMSDRHKEFLHLLETERNYVGILMMIVKDFKELCENINQAGGRILDPVEIRTIFGNILPVYQLHRHLLRDLACLETCWNDENLIGKVYCDRAAEFRKAYEPFVNFFETTKAEILRCEAEKPRFLAFLRIAQGRPECAKQSLADLMIRPIQRLPSTALILGNLKKYTKESNPDHMEIVKALEAMNSVNKRINEEKRVTDGWKNMLNLYNEIEGFPAHLISAQRSLKAKIECISLNSVLGTKFDGILLLLFNDHIQLAKKRHAGAGGNRSLASSANSVSNMNSPSMSRKSIMGGSQVTSNQSGQSSKHRYKFIEKIEFESVKRVVEVTDMDGAVFSLIVRPKNDVRERILIFRASVDTIDKWTKNSVVTTIAKEISTHLERIDHTRLMLSLESSELQTNDCSTVLGKAAKFASKTRTKVTRALSMSKSPSQAGKMKRTVSQIMMSPFTSSKRRIDRDTNSDFESSCSLNTTPLRSHLSTMSLFGFGSKRGIGDLTPKPRPHVFDMSESSIFETTEES